MPGLPAARIGDMHICPMVTGVVPHVGGPIAGPGVPTVLIGKMPAAVLGDMAICTGPPDVILKGSSTVLIQGKPAARMGDMCAHGGSILIGCPTVLIGDAGSGNAAGTQSSRYKGASTQQLVNKLNEEALQKAAESGEGLSPISKAKDLTAQFTLIDDAGQPISGIEYEVETPDGEIHSGQTDSAGKTTVLSGYSATDCRVKFKS